MWVLTNLDTNEEISSISNSAYQLSELSEGEYSISITVTDNYGSMSTTTQFFTITPPDFDGDNIETCVSQLWYDDLNQRHCGPDNVDKDDDNDDYLDVMMISHLIHVQAKIQIPTENPMK